jgi:F-type H+-transporting ATPase subunit delta
MSQIRISQRYAKALMDLAQERGKVPEVLEDIKGFERVAQNRDFYLLLQSPIVTADKKKDIVDKIFGGKISDITFGFINLCITKGREGVLPDMATAFINDYKQDKGIINIKVTTAAALSNDTLAAIKRKIIADVPHAKDVEVETVIKPELIGGYIVEFGDKLYDASVTRQLEDLKKGFSGNVYESQIEKR